MRPACNSTTPAVHAGNSPIPYLFSGLGLMFGLVAVALMILACSYRKSSSSSASTDPEAQEKSMKRGEMKAEMEPKIVVIIMAGDDSPTYLAMPVSCNCQTLLIGGAAMSSDGGVSAHASTVAACVPAGEDTKEAESLEVVDWLVCISGPLTGVEKEVKEGRVTFEDELGSVTGKLEDSVEEDNW
ncbi:hypothetical protein DKX38_027192 [Salix brachista]|uniref:Uncharacterized protein n=1 Tax=Salix brachista TaxID=2182728 RepID=A0A5N5JF14_9ROSI|nr:hypothetical protein DKX38_027192 [Salix brachista]